MQFHNTLDETGPMNRLYFKSRGKKKTLKGKKMRVLNVKVIRK